MITIIRIIFLVMLPMVACAEDGHQLWLRYQPVKKAKVSTEKLSPTIQIAKQELETYYNGEHVTLKLDASMPDDDGFSIDGTTITALRSIYAVARAAPVTCHPSPVAQRAAPLLLTAPAEPLGQPGRQHRARVCRQQHLLERRKRQARSLHPPAHQGVCPRQCLDRH